MPEIKKIVFWQPSISPHYVPMMRELCELYDEVVLVVVQAQSESRQKQGWALPDTGAIRTISLETADGVGVFENENTAHTLHIFSGTRGYGPIWQVFKMAMAQRAECAFLGEALDWHGVKGFLRFLVSAYDALRIKTRLRFILANGALGVWWYKRVGYPAGKIFEWAYYVEEQDRTELPAQQDDIIRFIYVGRLSKGKGLDWLLQTFQKLEANNFELHLVGDGPMREECQQLAAGFKRGKVVIHGQVPMGDIGSYYQGKDYLILPSTGKDGWGAVINEALQSGLPCIASNKCGASSVLINEQLGYVVDPKQQASLYLIINDIVQNKIKPEQSQRAYVKQFSSRLSGASGAKYLQSIIEYTVQGGNQKPVAPWKAV